MTTIETKKEELCGYGCGRIWDAEGDKNGFEDCVSAYHIKREKIPLIETILKEFEDYRNELHRLGIITERDNESPIVYFGYKRKIGNEVFTITDFGNIKSFLRSAFVRIREETLKEVIEKAEGMRLEIRDASAQKYVQQFIASLKI